MEENASVTHTNQHRPKKIPVSKISVEMLPLIKDLQSKLSTDQNKGIDEYIKKNSNLANAAAVTANLMN